MCLISIEENVLKQSDLSLSSMPGKLQAQSISFTAINNYFQLTLKSEHTGVSHFIF